MNSGSCSQISSSCNCPIPVQMVSAPSLVEFPAFPCLLSKRKPVKSWHRLRAFHSSKILVSVDEFPKGHRNENNRKKTKENIALLKDFFFTQK